MFTLPAVLEYLIVGAAAALLYGLCAFGMLGALQQAGYGSGRFFAWFNRKGNMARSRLVLLAFLIALSAAVLGVCFSFLGDAAGYIALLPVPLFVGIYCLADRRALKVPFTGTRRACRIYVIHVLLLFILSAGLCIAGAALAYYPLAQHPLAEHVRYILLALVPLLHPFVLAAANALEKPFSSAANKKYIARAREKLAGAPCVKVGITGSFGKTSVKNFLAAILSERWRVFATPASYNTPLGIAKAAEKEDLSQYDFFLAEMGARHKGDVAELCALVQPDHCILTGVCPQHLETFGSLEAVVAAKGEIFAGTKKGGFAVVGQDENTAALDPEKQGLVCVRVGEHGECGALNIKCGASGTDFTLALGIVQAEVHTKLLGAHNARNIALAAALAYKLGMSKEEILAGIGKIDYVPHRLQPYVSNGVTILDDAYNANVVGAEAALGVLRLFEGRKFVVTPGLVELGVLEEKENFALGEKLAGLDRVILVGATLVLAVKRGYLSAGGEEEKLTVVPSLKAAEELLSRELSEGDAVLFLNDLPDIYN